MGMDQGNTIQTLTGGSRMKFYTRYAVLRSKGVYFCDLKLKYFNLIKEFDLPALRSHFQTGHNQMYVIIPNKIK